jgi:hypothetical protein
LAEATAAPGISIAKLAINATVRFILCPVLSLTK